ncbi:ATP-binding protein [Cryobacterium sp. 5B3]|uniref:ATP-binding protein n=1 Tax=Cryobacterium sp. 5B3 TaxID=3048586 RepID=UPI002AB34E15|nr:SbcC/MukB-like Walker B domain-containing protein [Cryobacterium sp. 5B3]MDY7541793.1 SbcC/MukB-like Walker B domain-containing protein [Cryobacterium sp. 5B3]MEB0275227.1 SbcC/MukB-like Walker B domain-containing protein [Cryobacterium sp. 5B3]
MTLDLVIPAQPRPGTGHSQWHIEALQMANWGGFQGRTEVRFSPGSNLMSGASGSGKSTVLDAYLALMMPSDTPFNGASNDAGGRARSAEQRNLLTYLRGKMDTSRVGGSDELRDTVLRGGDGQAIWGALAGTFINDDGRRYTALRIYFAKAGASVGGDVTTTFAAVEGYLDISRLTPLAASRFDKRALKAALPGLVTFNTFYEFEDNIHTRLGIGGGDGGRKAMRLLARVQGGMQVKRVDGLYKSMVLEEPITYQVADEALEHFANLEAAYLKMTDEADKVKALHRLPGLQQDLAAAQARELLIGQFGADDQAPSPFRLWMLRTERGLLDTAVAENRRAYADTVATYTQAKTEEADYEDQLAQIAEDKRSNGGEAIDERQGEIVRLGRSRDEVYSANVKFQTRTEAINLVAPETAEQFAEAQVAAADFLEGYGAREASLRLADEEIRLELSPLINRQVDLMDEKKSLTGRAGSVPKRLHEARVKMAQAAGLDPMNDLPFVAELLDVLPEEARWRKAVENTLGGIARTVLVDRDTRDRLSAAIDGVQIRPRIRFQAVSLAEHQDWRGDSDHISGKLAFKDSPFSRWVQDRVSDSGVDHLCVADTASLDGREARVTLSGQTRNGDKGAHGESGEGDIIGFSNERRLAEIDRLLTELEPEIAAVRKRIADVQTHLSDLRLQKDAHVYVQDAIWSAIDHLGVDRRIVELEDEIARLRAANRILDALQEDEERIRPLLKEANRVRVLASESKGKLEARHSVLVSGQDEAQDGVDAIVNAQTATVTEAQQDYLNALFAGNWDATSLDSFARNMSALRRRLGEESEAARKSARNAVSAMESMFEAYKDRWTEHNLGVKVASADGYREILDRIQSEGLYERRDRWRREFASWSSDDLLRLSDAFDTALEDIEDRLAPINRILETLPFGGKGILQISLRRLPSAELSVFRRRLRELSSGLALELTDQQVEERFKKLQAFMTPLRIPEGHTKSSTSQRDRYLDVRQHVVITAVCLDENRREIASYDSLGGKSGGETQELVAFIVGSALRYQLGDESRSRPRFAPVFLDEGFVKSDGEFAGRAIKAWQDLGFQLIIGAPYDKVTALEPHMNRLLGVTKNDRGHSFVSDLRDPDAQLGSAGDTA